MFYTHTLLRGCMKIDKAYHEMPLRVSLTYPKAPYYQRQHHRLDWFSAFIIYHMKRRERQLLLLLSLPFIINTFMLTDASHHATTAGRLGHCLQAFTIIAAAARPSPLSFLADDAEARLPQVRYKIIIFQISLFYVCSLCQLYCHALPE